MSETPEVVTPASDPLASLSPEALSAAFASAAPIANAPTPEPYAAPVAPEVSAPVVAPTEAPAAIAPETVAPTTPDEPDYAAWVKQTYGVESPDALKTALEVAKEAEALKANQRTDADRAFEKLLADPAAATAFVKLQATDYKTLPARELLAAKYAHDHPELPAELAALEAEEEYNARYAAAEFEDADDPQVKAAKLRLDYATRSAADTMERVKEEAKQAVLSKGAPVAEGPTEAQIAQDEARSAAWLQGVETVVGAPEIELSYDVDGQKIALTFDNKSAAFKEAMLNPMEWLLKEVRPTGKPEETNYDRLAEIIALSTQTGVMLKNSLAAGKASLGAVLPLSTAVNPAPNAPQAPSAGLSLEEAIRQSAQNQNRGRNLY